MDESDVEPEEMDIMISFNGGEPVLTSVDLDTARQIAKEINAEIALVSSKITADAKTCLKSMQFIPKGSKEFHKGVGHHKIDKIVL